MIGQKKPEPLYSTLSHVSELSDRIDDFIVGLADRLDNLQEADNAGDLKEANRLAEELANEGVVLGFEPLADFAAAVVTACERADAETVHERLRALTEVVQRVRLGHRGAA